ncbi:GspH/FimT family pseudopilin [Shewanella sp. 30m-9]
MRDYKKTIHAFTLVELMVTLAVATILISIAAPSLTAMYEASRSDSAIRNIKQSLTFARSHAISYGAIVTVCPLSGTKCGTDWKGGYSIFIDNGTVGTIDSTGAVTDQVIREVDAFNSNDFVSYALSSISFSPEGMLTGISSGANRQIVYCPSSKTNEHSKAVDIISSGKVRTSTATGLSCS